jgi:ElaB/YqjD/DUF883 family membrane-anchored ribosome-binding protein
MLHLLSTLPIIGPSHARARMTSPTPTSSSWDSLPSDAEETFFLSGSEDYEEYERVKKQRWIAALREERLREREKEDLAAPASHDAESAAEEWLDDEEASCWTFAI